MKYFIPNNNELKEVSEQAYDYWCENEKQNYVLEDFYFPSHEGDKYGIETMYQGACDVDELPPLPFIVIFFSDKSIIAEKGIKTKPEHEEFYFAKFDEMKAKYQSILEEHMAHD